MKALRPIRHEDRLSVIDHLDELRSRLFACAGVLLVVFGFCFWQNTHLIAILNHALPAQSKTQLGVQSKADATLHQSLLALQQGAKELTTGLEQSTGVNPAAIAGAQRVAAAAGAAAKSQPNDNSQRTRPVTLGVGEGFTVTLTVVAYFTLLISLPVLLYQLYAFVLPALSRDERRVAVPTMIAAPMLFIAGAVFTYFEVLPPAVHFLQGYNSSQFNNLLSAKAYYRFAILLMLGLGLAFQVPLLLLGLQKVGVITAKSLRGNWRYAVVIIAVITAALPGVDPVTMIFETLPLIVLYLASIVMLTLVERRAAKRERQLQ